MSLADLSAAAHLSVTDYFGDIDWDRHPEARLWYAKIKSRPSFRDLLEDVVAGLAPSQHYTDLDF
jgi:glutathione S-transferase